VFFGSSVHANGTQLYSARIIPFKGSWIEFATDINNVMYAYIDRKKKLPVTTLLRAIGFEEDKDILSLFNLAEEVKVNKTNLKKAIGRKLAGNVVKTWTEDFVDEDTGEVFSIERVEVVLERETVLDEDNIQSILESGVELVLLHHAETSGSDYSIIFNTPRKLLALVALEGTLTMLMRNVLMNEFGLSQAIGSFAAAAVVGISALKVIHIVHTPNTLLIIPPIIPLVPGVLLYRLLFAILHIQTISAEELLQALRFGVDGMTIILAIVIGVSIPNIFIQSRIEAQQQSEINAIIARRSAEK